MDCAFIRSPRLKSGLISLAAAVAAALFSISPAAAITYQYTGNDFAYVAYGGLIWTTSDSLTGIIVLSAPFGNNSTGYVTPTYFSFSDGVETLTSSNASGTFAFNTDALGDIVSWDVRIEEVTPQGNIDFRSITDSLPTYDLISNWILDASGTSADSYDPGSWAVVNDVSITPLPASLPLFASGLGGLGLLHWRRKRKTLRNKRI